MHIILLYTVHNHNASATYNMPVSIGHVYHGKDMVCYKMRVTVERVVNFSLPSPLRGEEGDDLIGGRSSPTPGPSIHYQHSVLITWRL